MKKVFSYLLALTLLVSTMTVSMAAPVDVTDASQVQAVDVLMALGIVNGYEDGTYKPANPITRAEMAKMIVTALGYKNYADGTESTFTDMDGHWANGYVEVCAGKGILKGYEIAGTDKREFRPNNPITYDEAATVLLRALGYSDEVLTEGEWPLNYYIKAKNEGIFNNVNYAKTSANRGDIALMLYNSLALPIGVVEDGKYTPQVLSTSEEGKEVYETILTRLSAKKRGDFIVSGEENTKLYIRDKVASFCEVYENTESKEDILFMELSTSLKGKFSQDLKAFTTDEGAEWICKPSLTNTYGDKNIEVFYNGEKTELTGTDLKDISSKLVAKYKDMGDFKDMKFNIAAKVSGKTLLELYTISIWNPTKATLAEENVQEDIVKRMLLGAKFKMDDDGKIDINSFELLGVSSLGEIKAGDVVYVYEGKEYIRKIEVGTKELKDVEIDTVKSDLTELTTDKVAYKVSVKPAFYKDAYFPEAGDKVNMKLDYHRNIYWAEPASQYSKYALFKKFEVKDEATTLDLILAKGKNEKVDSLYTELSPSEIEYKLYPGLIRKATGQLYKVSYDNHDRVCRLEAAKETTAKLDEAREAWIFDKKEDVHVIELTEHLDLVEYTEDAFKFGKLGKEGEEPDFLPEVKMAKDLKYVRQNADKENLENNIYMLKTDIAFKGVFTSKTMKMKSLRLYDVDGDGVYEMVVYQVEAR